MNDFGLIRYNIENIDREYTHMVLERSDGNSSLMEPDAIRAMCDLESRLTKIHGYRGICQMKFYSKECCRPWSIPNYISLLANKTTCHDIEVNIDVSGEVLNSDSY